VHEVGILEKKNFSVSQLLNALHNETFEQFRCLRRPLMSLNITDDAEPFNKKNRKQNVRNYNA